MVLGSVFFFPFTSWEFNEEAEYLTAHMLHIKKNVACENTVRIPALAGAAIFSTI